MKTKTISLFLVVAVLAALLAVPASAVSFTPSVEGKEAPSVTTVTDASGSRVAALIHDADGNEVAGVTEGNLIVTPVSGADQAEENISEALTKAYEQIQAAEDLTELVPDLEKRLQGTGVSVADLVVRDVFDVTVTGDYADYLAEDGNTITVRFNLGLDPDALLLVLHNYSGSDWEAIADERVVRNADGSVDVTFDSLSPVAFVVDKASVTADPNAPTSPQTSDNSIPFAGIAAALLVLAAVSGVALTRKKHAAE